jgi:Cu-Zn family superoxide dismutase
MNQIDAKGVGKLIGTIRAEDSKKGLVLKIDLKDLPPGDHGFHVHEHGKCDPQEKEAPWQPGWRPAVTTIRTRPVGTRVRWGRGTWATCRLFKVDASGKVKSKVTAPRLKVADLKGRALMIHEGGDNYSDNPKPLGGGGARIACGVVE